jgi:hypothetical protein
MHEPRTDHYDDHGPEGPGWLGVLVGGAAGVLLGLVIALLLGLGSTTTTRTVTKAAAPAKPANPNATVITVTAVPDVVGQPLDLAQQRMSRAGFKVDVNGGGLLGVVVPENWQVVAQDPPGGERLERGSTVTLDIDRG